MIMVAEAAIAARRRAELEAEVDADLDTLATGLYVTSDDFLADNPQYRPWRPRVGLAPRLTDAELVTLVVLQALLGFTSEARLLRYANTHCAFISLSANTIGLQQEDPRGDRHAAGGDRAPGRTDQQRQR